MYNLGGGVGLDASLPVKICKVIIFFPTDAGDFTCLAGFFSLTGDFTYLPGEREK